MKIRSTAPSPVTCLIVVAAIATSTALLASYAGAQQKQQAVGDPNRACLSHLKQYAVGMMMYAQDYDETFPPMRTPKHVQNPLRPYVKREAVFYCPVTKQPYQPIKALSGKRLSGVKEPAKTPMLLDAKPHPDGAEHTAYADGHVKPSKPSARKMRP